MDESSEKRTRVLVVVGQTGGGKERASLAAAALLDGEIVSCDSMKVYRGMDIGTAKAGAEERRLVRHHCIDIADPWQVCSAAWWLQCADAAIADITARGKLPIFSGGTVLYLKALLYGLFEGPAADLAIRQRLKDEAAARGSTFLHERLATVDAPAAKRIHHNDLRRIVRALEVYELTGQPISARQQQFGQIRTSLNPLVVALRRQKEDLHRRIDLRVQRMIDAGLVDEVRALLARPEGLAPEAAQAVGYREIIDHLQGRLTLQAAIDAIRTNTRQFAKRQMTHLRGLAHRRWLDVSPDESAEETARRIADIYNEDAAGIVP